MPIDTSQTGLEIFKCLIFQNLELTFQISEHFQTPISTDFGVPECYVRYAADVITVSQISCKIRRCVET